MKTSEGAAQAPAPGTVCPRCGGPNQCAPAKSGSLETACWCTSASVSRRALAELPAELRNKVCLCPACAALADGPLSRPEPADGAGFPKVYSAIKWGIVGSLALLAVAATIFWAFVLGGFADGGLRASRAGGAGENVPITPECAWPYSVHDHDAVAVCRMFYNLTPEQRGQVLKARR